MRLWFGGLAALLGFPGKDEASIQAILRLAVARSAPIGIGNVDGVALPSPLAGHVLELESDALVISRPFEGSSRRELVTGERLHLSIASDRGFHHGDVEVLGRFVAGEGHERRYGYRVSIPRALMHEERRGLHRVPVAFDLAPKSVLFRPITLEEIGEGIVQDISEGGLCVRASLGTMLRPGEQVVVRAEFPAVLPSIHTRATVAHVVEARKAGEHEIGLRFNEPQDALGQAIRALELRRINRAGAA
jgi:PilZ domain